MTKVTMKDFSKEITRANKGNVKAINKGIDKLQKTAKKHPNATMALVAGAAAAVIVDAGCKIAYVGIPTAIAMSEIHKEKRAEKKAVKAAKKAEKEAAKAAKKDAKKAAKQKKSENK